MDYLCELPNDATRRKALDSLPPDLNSTYERILSRVNQGSAESQTLVRRALRWIANDFPSLKLTIKGLCEAVSIDLGSTRRNLEAVPDEFEILRRCSSLVRKSEDGKKLELAHFTVKEFLQQIDPKQDLSIGAYRHNPGIDELILAKVCLTYLMFDNFDQGGPFSPEVVKRRHLENPFRQYAILWWRSVAESNPDDTELFTLVQKLLDPSKPNTFLSWAQDLISSFDYSGRGRNPNDTEALSIIDSGLAEATPLHFATILDLPKVCDWLIRSGCDVNRNTKFGTPLHCAILLWPTFYGRFVTPSTFLERNNYGPDDGNEVMALLLDSGADPNCDYSAGTGQLSPLFMALSRGHWNKALQLLDKGGRLDNPCLEILENHSRREDVSKLIAHACNYNVVQENRDRLFQLALRAKTPDAARLVPKNKDLSGQNSHYKQNMRTAAEYGQVQIMLGLLEDHSLDVNAADESTGLTALHHAAKTDQLGVAQILLDRGADLGRLDNLRRTALHHCILSGETHCLQFFLQKGADTRSRDLEGMTIWHLAASEGNVQALSVLLSMQVDLASTTVLKANDGRTPLLCASARGSKEAIELLLNAGSNLTETASNGSSPLHYAAESGSLESVEFLVGKKVLSCMVTCDGSTALHYGVAGSWEKVAGLLRILIENGVDPCKARNDGCTPLHVLMNMMKDESNKYGGDALDQIFAAGRTLLERMLKTSRSASNLRLGSELIYLACSHPFSRAHGVVLSLLNLDLELDTRFANGMNALMAAAERGNDDILDALLTHGADPCLADDSGLNALHFACFNGHKNILVLLKNTSIDWNKESATTIMNASWRKKVTPLHIAAQSHDSRVLEYVLNQGLTLKIDACTDQGETPLSVAVWHSTPENVSLLLSKEAETSVIDSYGHSAVHWAANYGFEEVISEFIEHGSNLGLPNSSGLTPELVARKYGHEALATAIMDYVNQQSEFRRFTLVVFG